jgi:hypothetical protein
VMMFSLESPTNDLFKPSADEAKLTTESVGRDYIIHEKEVISVR